jgi:hypothetical protein
MHLQIDRKLISLRGGALTSAAALALCASAAIAQDRWDTFGGSATHSLIAPASPTSIAAPACRCVHLSPPPFVKNPDRTLFCA